MNYYWRVFATGTCFLIFFLGGLVISLICFPLIVLFTLNKDLKEKRVQFVIHFLFRRFVALLSFAGLFNFYLSGHDQLRQMTGKLIIANHPTLIDVVVLMSMMSKAQCVVKHELWDSKFLGGVVRAAGYIRNDGDPEKLITDCSAKLNKGENVILFPEGTRTKPGQEVNFKRGFANVALSAGCDIQLVSITCSPITLSKGDKWYQVPYRKADFTVEVENKLDIARYMRQEPKSVAVRQLTRDLENYYKGKSA